MSAALNTPPAVIAEKIAAEAERQDSYRGYHAGYALATDPHHRGSKFPEAWVLDAIVNLRSKGHGPRYLDGFRQGYITGLASQEVARSGQ